MRRRHLATNLEKGNEPAPNNRRKQHCRREQNIVVGWAEHDLHFKVEEKEESLSLLRTMDVLISTCNYDIKMWHQSHCQCNAKSIYIQSVLLRSPWWPAPSPGPPDSRCQSSRSHCSRWAWWRFRRWCWRSVRRWRWRWTGFLSSCWGTAARSGTCWWELVPRVRRHRASPSAGAGDGSSPPGWATWEGSGAGQQKEETRQGQWNQIMQHWFLMTHLMQLFHFLQLPLVLGDETVSSGPPAGQVLLSTHIGHGCVQHLPSPPLHPCSGQISLLRWIFLEEPSQTDSLFQDSPGLPVSDILHKLSS